MDAVTIIDKLKGSTFVYSEASRIRDEIRRMEEEDRNRLIHNLRIECTKPENAQLQRVLQEMTWKVKS
jgi:hypothetical protein